MTLHSSKASVKADSLEAKKYFFHQDFKAQLANDTNSDSLVFEFLGKSARDLYVRCMEILRNQEGNKEIVPDYSIDLYSTKKISTPNCVAEFAYNYFLKFKDGKIIIENPFIGLTGNMFTLGLGTLSEYFAKLETIPRQHGAGKTKQEYNQQMINGTISCYSIIINELNNLTDSIVHYSGREQLEDPGTWVIESSKPSFELSLNGLSCNNGLNYIAYKIPNANVDRAKKMTEELINFLQCDNSLEYKSNSFRNTYEFYAKRNISSKILDLYYSLNSGLGSKFSVIYKIGNYQKIRITKTINASKKIGGVMTFDMEITFADGCIRFKLPEIKEIIDINAYGNCNWLNKENQYRSMFSSPDGRVLEPQSKQAVEQYFDELFNFLSTFYSPR
jgi:hypothetical protein